MRGKLNAGGLGTFLPRIEIDGPYLALQLHSSVFNVNTLPTAVADTKQGEIHT